MKESIVNRGTKTTTPELHSMVAHPVINNSVVVDILHTEMSAKVRMIIFEDPLLTPTVCRLLILMKSVATQVAMVILQFKIISSIIHHEMLLLCTMDTILRHHEAVVIHHSLHIQCNIRMLQGMINDTCSITRHHRIILWPSMDCHHITQSLTTLVEGLQLWTVMG
jgi:hypothetical protein